MANSTIWTIAGAALACMLSSSVMAQSLVLTQSLVLAQSSAPAQTVPNMPAPSTPVPEKIGPDATGSTGNLSEKLNRSDGVIAPPAGVDSGMATRAPAANAGAMPIITPPGEPGGNQSIQPK